MDRAMGRPPADALPAGDVRPRQRSLPTAGPPQCMGDDDAVARRHGLRGSPRNGNDHVIAQVVFDQLGVPAAGPAAAVDVVALGPGQAVAVGQAHGRAVAGDVAGIAFNAQAVTVVAQIVAAEASWWPADGPAVARRGSRSWSAVPAAAWPAGRRPSERRGRRGGPVAWPRTVGRGLEPRHEAAAGGPAGMPALRGWASGRPRTGRRGRVSTDRDGS
jgi:hypothetical protein